VKPAQTRKFVSKTFGILVFVVLVVAPFFVVGPINNHYNRYEEIAKEYECYPIEKCKFDFNGDGKFDSFSVVNEPTNAERYNYRLKIYVENGGLPREIINLRYDSTDNTFRTHLAPFEESGIKKLVVYDTINPVQFFVWNGSELAVQQERSLLERDIWNAMSLEDDTGGRWTKFGLEITLIAFFGLYYFVLVAGTVLYIHLQRKLTKTQTYQ